MESLLKIDKFARPAPESILDIPHIIFDFFSAHYRAHEIPQFAWKTNESYPQDVCISALDKIRVRNEALPHLRIITQEQPTFKRSVVELFASKVATAKDGHAIMCVKVRQDLKPRVPGGTLLQDCTVVLPTDAIGFSLCGDYPLMTVAAEMFFLGRMLAEPFQRTIVQAAVAA